MGSSPFQSASAQRFAQSSSIRQHGRVGLVSGRHGRKSLRVAAILSNGPRAVEQVSAVGPAPPVKTRSLGTPLAEQLPAFERDSVVAHAGGDAASEAVPLPEPERTPQIDVNWLNAVIDNTVKVGWACICSCLHMFMIMQVSGIQQLSTHAGNGSCTTWSAAPCQQHCLLCMEPFTAVVQDTVLLINFLALGGINSTLDLNQPSCCVLGPSTAGAVQCLQ